MKKKFLLIRMTGLTKNARNWSRIKWRISWDNSKGKSKAKTVTQIKMRRTKKKLHMMSKSKNLEVESKILGRDHETVF